MFSLPYVVIMAGLSFGGAMTVIGFGGLLGAWFHRELGTPLPLPTLRGPVERRLYTYVGIGRIRRVGLRVPLEFETLAVSPLTVILSVT